MSAIAYEKTVGLVANLWPNEIIEDESKFKTMCVLFKMVH